MNPLLLALVQAGLITQAEAERIDRMLDPGAARVYAERVLGDAIQRGLLSQQTRYLDLVERANGYVSPAQLDAFWLMEDGALWETIRPTLLALVNERSVAVAIGMGNVDGWMAVNEAVIDWAQTYYAGADGALYGSIPNLNLTSRTQVLQAFTDWQRGELERAGVADGLPQLARALEPVFGAGRAENIATTEVTRIFVASERMAAEVEPAITQWEFRTANDERVCPYCSPRNGQRIAKNAEGFTTDTDQLISFPPLHPRCRCQIIPLSDLAADAPVARRSERTQSSPGD